MDPQFAGFHSQSGFLVLEVDKTKGLIELDKTGIPHPSYKYGVHGRVVGKISFPKARDAMFPDYIAKRRAEGKDPTKDWRSVQLGHPVQEITPELAKELSATAPSLVQSNDMAEMTLDLAPVSYTHLTLPTIYSV